MQNRVKRTICLVLIGLLSFCSIKPELVYASSATVGFEVEEASIMVGDEFTVALTVKTDVNLGDFEGNIVYNSAVLEYVQGPACISGGYGMLRIEDMEASSSWNTRSYVMTFKAIDSGDCEFSFVDTPIVYEYENKEAMSVSATSKTVNIEGEPVASTENGLANIKIGTFSITPSFDSSVTDYSVIVDSTTTQLILSAIPIDSKAKVEVEGNHDFVVGNNDVSIVVSAESGLSKQYTIHVQKEEKEIVTLPVAEQPVKNFSFHASLEDGLTLLNGSYQYTVVSADDSITIPEGYIRTNIKIDGYSVPVYQISAKVDDDYLLLILQNQYGQNNLYRYDRVEKTIQRYTGERVLIQGNPDEAERTISQMKRSYESKLGRKNFIIAILAGVVIILVIGVIRLYLRTKGIKEDEYF